MTVLAYSAHRRPRQGAFRRPAAAARLSLLILLLVPLAAFAQPGGPGPSPVGFTEAQRSSVRRTVTLSGTVESRRSSIVASEVAGLVVELSAREGQAVDRGAPLVKLRQETLELRRDAAVADFKEAQARLDLAQQTLDRNRELFESGVVARQILDDSTSELTAWQGRVERLTVEIARVEDDLSRSVVRAPFSGVLVEEMIQTGEWLAVGGEVAELMALDELEVSLEVPERYFRELRRGLPVAVTFGALPDFEVEGKVRAVIPRADPQARTFPVKVAISNRERRIGVGMLAQASFPFGEPYPALVVPKDAVVDRAGNQMVFRIGADGTVEPVPVQAGSATGAWVEVRGPLAPGDRVITRGNERVAPGQPVAGEPVQYEPPP